ncbi:sn-1,2-diacylglycerol ethanolamine- and cholinephosphotransferase [Pseudoloma neurophilia]|uniref:sn-1,2-diacylglycerol ethanolamine-and cholinephosphotransferase n=1 Tax=Pseudoloma neurophilia TaxID=146866 RepID=A0A0R0M0S1_9MICR|nr:sn-1,2-diacylglycerol ethanolamine- and cholinephosphotransferase [Pseudoloma neurophilia]
MLRYKNIRFITDEAHEERKKALLNYKYNGVDKSLISKYVMNHIWNASVKLFPKWLAPNCITLFGLFFTLISFSLSLYYDFECAGKAPSWVYFSHAACLFLYMLCDAVDGKQARRTNTGSPLGQLFDHVVDSFVASLTVIMLASALGLGISIELVLFLINFKFCVFYANLEEFFTHEFILGTINGPTEGILSGIVVFLLAGFFGPECFYFLFGYNLHSKLTDLAVFGIFMATIVVILTTFTVLKDPKVNERSQVIFHALTPITFYITFFMLTKQLDKPWKFYILLLCEMSNFSILIIEMIYASFAHLEIPAYSPTTIAFILMLIITYHDNQLYILTAGSVISLLIVIYAVFNEIADILEISIFTIPVQSETVIKEVKKTE